MEKKNPNIYQRALDIVNNRINPDIPQGGGGGIPDAPIDGKQYARKNGAWSEVQNGTSYDDTAIKARVSAIEAKESTWDAKSNFSGDYNDLTNKPTIPIVPQNVSAFNNDSGYLTQHQSLEGYATESYVQNYHDTTKQDVVTDLASIRSGAALGATAVQPEAGKGLFSGNYNDLTNKPTIPAAVTDAHINSLIDAKLNALDGNGVAY